MNSNNKTNKKIKNINRKIKRIKRTIKRKNRIVRRRRRRVRRVRKNIINYKSFRKYMRVVRTDSTTMVVSGLDLVYTIPDEEIHNGSNVLTIIPANPAYWTGTRIASIALGYQQYRPLKFIVHYVPIVSAMQQGNVFGGSIWTNAPIDTNNIQKILVTSSGGMSTQVFNPKSVNVRCKDNLKQNLYNIGGEMSDESNPFYYVAIGVGNFAQNARVTPGYFWVSYTYSFKNPIGTTQVFANTGLTTLDEIEYHLNTTALLCQPKSYEVGNKIKTIGIFSEIQIDTTANNEMVATYNGDFVPLGEDDKLWVFQNYGLDEAVRGQNRFIIKVKPNNQLPWYQDQQGEIRLPKYTKCLFVYNDSTDLHFIINGDNFRDYHNVLYAYRLDNDDIPQFSGLIPESVISAMNVQLDPLQMGNYILYMQYDMDSKDQFISIREEDANKNVIKDLVVKHKIVKPKIIEDKFDDLDEELEIEEENLPPAPLPAPRPNIKEIQKQKNKIKTP